MSDRYLRRGAFETLGPIERSRHHTAVIENSWMRISTTFESRSEVSLAGVPPKRTPVCLSPNELDGTMTLRLEGNGAAMQLGLRPQIRIGPGDPVSGPFTSPAARLSRS